MATAKQIELRIKFAKTSINSLTKKISIYKAKVGALEAVYKTAKTARMKTTRPTGGTGSTGAARKRGVNMKLSGYNKAYQESSGRASDVARQLAFAGIALIWIFRVEGPQTPRLPEQLLLPSALLVLALGFDLLHYIVKTIIWGSFHRYHEKKLKYIEDDPELVARPWYNWPGNTFFVLKLISVIAAYVLIFIYIWGQWVCK